MTDAISYLGHASLLLETGGARLLTDPVLGSRVGHIRRRVEAPRMEDFLPLDGVLVSHAHADHLDPATLRRISRDCPVVAPQGCGTILRRRGFREIIEVAAGERVSLGDIPIEAVPALHDGRRYPFGRPRAALGFLVGGPVRVYFAGDTDVFAEMDALAGRVDVAALPVWGWGPRVPRGHLNPERAAQAAALVRPRVAIPIHWGTLAAIGSQRRLDPLEPPRAFARATARLAPEVEVRILMPGERSLTDLL